jgi:hypothetical protein
VHLTSRAIQVLVSLSQSSLARFTASVGSLLIERQNC